MKLLFVVIRPDGGGAERTVAILQRELRRLSVDVVTASIDAPRPDEMIADGIVLTKNNARGVRRIAAASQELGTLISSFEPDIVHLHCEAPEMAFAFGVLRRSVPRTNVLVTEHSQNAWSGVRKPLRQAVRMVTRSRSLNYEVVDCFPNGTHRSHIPNPVMRPTLAASTGPTRLVILGRLVPTKRVGAILDAAKVAGWSKSIEVIGDGPERDRLQRLSRELNLDTNFRGFQANPWHLVHDGDTVVTASALEGDPLSVLEAVASNLSIVASTIPPHVSILGPQHPGLFDTEVELARLIRLVADGVKFHASPSQRSRLDDREPQAIARRWISHYRQFLA